MRSLGTWGPAPPTSAASWSFLLGHLLPLLLHTATATATATRANLTHGLLSIRAQSSSHFVSLDIVLDLDKGDLEHDCSYHSSLFED